MRLDYQILLKSLP